MVTVTTTTTGTSPTSPSIDINFRYEEIYKTRGFWCGTGIWNSQNNHKNTKVSIEKLIKRNKQKFKKG